MTSSPGTRRVVRSLAAFASLLVLPLGAGVANAGAGDPLRVEQYGLDQSRFPEAWQASTGDGVVVAVVDTGVDLAHPDLAGRLVPGIDLVEPGREPTDDNGHGTHVAGVVAASAGNGAGISGAAPGAMIMPVRVLDAEGAGDPATIAEGIRWAVDNGARVVNLSLGGTGLSARLLKGGQINAAIRYAYGRGAVVVAAAGNDGAVLRSYRFGVPVVVVNAVDAAGNVAEFSNVGDARAVSAAGVDIVSTTPTSPSTLFGADTSGYGRLSGTSMAAPLVSALAALLLAQGRTADAVVEAVAATAVNASGDPALGDGIIDAAAAVSLANGQDPGSGTVVAAAGTADAAPATATASPGVAALGDLPPTALLLILVLVVLVLSIALVGLTGGRRPARARGRRVGRMPR
jgi:subtilisin family serine protease